MGPGPSLILSGIDLRGRDFLGEKINFCGSSQVPVFSVAIWETLQNCRKNPLDESPF
jgi:hypothetical protein